MHLLLALYWFAVPLAPLNPVEQDTLPVSAIHTSLGLAVGNGTISPGPELAVNYELLLVHPIVARAGVEMRVGNAHTRIWPGGDQELPVIVRGPCRSMALGVDLFYYRGTHKLTGYLGLGAIYSFQYFSAGDASASYLMQQYGIDNVAMSRQFGYRFFLGLRFKKVYSLEIGVSELRPDATYSGHQNAAQFFSGSNQARLGSFRISIGRVWTIRGT